MAIDLPVVGQQNWGEPLNASLRDMDVTRPGSAAEAALALKANAADVYSRAETGTQITNAITASRPPLYGTGFPNGVVAAPVGALYADTAVTNGASLWQKVSGMGNTGWEVARGDTGVRNVSALLGPDWTIAGVGVAMLTLQRVGSRVTLRFGGKSVVAKNYAPLLVLPTGFRVAGFGVLGGASMTGVPFTQLSMGVWAAQYTVALGPGPVAEGTSVTGFAVAETFDPWPATLPGTN